MSIVCYERHAGQSGTLGLGGPESFAAGYAVHGTLHSALAVEAVLQRSPPAVVGRASLLHRQPMKINEKGQGLWHIDVDYKPAEKDDKKNDDDQAEPLAFKISWDTAGGTTKVTESFEVEARDGNPNIDTGTVIGWDGKKVNGCEIVAPKLRLTVDVFYAPSAITIGRVMDWARATGKTNNDQWLTFQPWELLFLGCSGEQTFSMLNGKSTKPVPVSFKIDCSENREDPFRVGELTCQQKYGWDFLDVFYGEKTVGVAPDLITVATPLRLKVHRVYDGTNFKAFMGIG